MCITIGGLPWISEGVSLFGGPRKLPWLLPRTSVVIFLLPWQWPRMCVEIATAVSVETIAEIPADTSGLPWLVRRSLSRTEPRHAPWPQPWRLRRKCHEPWHLSWKPAAFHISALSVAKPAEVQRKRYTTTANMMENANHSTKHKKKNYPWNGWGAKYEEQPKTV